MGGLSGDTNLYNHPHLVGGLNPHVKEYDPSDLKHLMTSPGNSSKVFTPCRTNPAPAPESTTRGLCSTSDHLLPPPPPVASDPLINSDYGRLCSGTMFGNKSVCIINLEGNETHHVYDAPETCCKITQQFNTMFIFQALLSGATCSVLLDTGASHCFLSSTFAEKIGLVKNTMKESINVSLADNQHSVVSESCTFKMKLANNKTAVQAYVLPDITGSVDVILGMDWLAHHDVTLNCKNGTAKICFNPDKPCVTLYGTSSEEQIISHCLRTLLHALPDVQYYVCQTC